MDAFTYVEVGATAEDVLPTGYHHVQRSRIVGRGTEDFERAAAALAGFDVHRRAGLRVSSPDPAARAGTELIMGLGVGPLRVRARCRVVYVVDTDARRGWAYGTLPGHPESGEELFVLDLGPDEVVTFTVRAFSRPASALARFAGPAGRLVQAWQTSHYLSAMAALVPF